MIYRESGFPYSDELYHHGILGQKWGVRRYQNPDGTLTVAGKVRYGMSQVAKAVGSGTKKAVSSAVLSYKRKHPNLMSDEELEIEISKQRKLNELYSERKKTKDYRNANTSRARKIVADCFESGMKIVSSKLFNAVANKIFDKKDPAIRELGEVLSDPKATIQEIRVAKEKFETATKYNSQKAYNEYVENFNKEFMRDYTKKKGATMPTKDVLESTAEYAELLRRMSGSGGGGAKKKKKGGGD